MIKAGQHWKRKKSPNEMIEIIRGKDRLGNCLFRDVPNGRKEWEVHSISILANYSLIISPSEIWKELCLR
jgi:hypothetical protein